MNRLPLAVEQSIYITKFGESYFGTCHKCKKQLDCFNFTTDWKKGITNLDKINIICVNRCHAKKQS